VNADESLREILCVVFKPVRFEDISTSAVCLVANGILDEALADA
jgi:hypothetical protein